jgi:serine/threonine protein kinase
LQEIHNAGVLHGDIRRPNLLIDNLGHACIIDFDWSKKTLSAKAKEEELKRLVDVLDSEVEYV